MAGSTNASLDSLTAQVNELSTMLDQVESGLQDIHRAWDGISRREFRRYGLSSTERRKRETLRENDTGRTGVNNTSDSTIGNTAGNPFANSVGMNSDLLSNLGAVFGKSPDEMMDLLGKAQQILTGAGSAQGSNTDLMTRMQEMLAGNNVSGQVGAAGANPIPVGVSASVAKVAANLPTKLQAIARSVYDAADQDPFVRTAVELDSRLRDMSETIESMIGIFLLVRDISSRTRSM